MTLATARIPEPQARRWTRDEFYRLAKEGWFQGQRVQLIDGEIIQMPPQGHPHAKAIVVVDRWLHDVFKDDYVIRIQMPLNVLSDSDPEPDAAVVPGPLDKYDDHPQTALLVIEVSDSSLLLDREKASLYAAAGIQEYWIVDVEHCVVEIYRQPTKDKAAPRGFRYSKPVLAKHSDSISCLAKPKANLKVADLFR